MGFRYPKRHESEGKWNTMIKDEKSGEMFDPALTFIDSKDGALECAFYEHDTGEVYKRQVPFKICGDKEGKIPVTTIFDLSVSQRWLARPGCSGDCARKL